MVQVFSKLEVTQVLVSWLL